MSQHESAHPPAAPFVDHHQTLAVSGWEIPAALTLPATHAPGASVTSAVLLVPGSLYSNVDGDFPAWKVYPRVYAHLAEQLAALGHAVYRFAKLGPGTGSVAVDEAASRRVQTWAGRTTIARAAWFAMEAALREHGVRAERLVMAGHSEGAVVAACLAQTLPDVDGVVLLGAPSRGILDIMREQQALYHAPEVLDAVRADFDAVVAHIRRGEPIPEALRDRPGVKALGTMPPDGLAYMRDCDATDPVAEVARVEQPVLILQGGRDPTVPPHHAERLRAARGTRPTEVVVIPELQHMLKPLPGGVQGMEAFGLAGPVDARATDAIDRWIRRLPARA